MFSIEEMPLQAGPSPLLNDGFPTMKRWPELFCFLAAVSVAGCAQQPLTVRRPPEPPAASTSVAVLEPPGPQKPKIDVIPRERWTSVKPILSEINPMGRIWRITVHHEGRACDDGSWLASVLRLRGIQKAHLNNKWADIGYHFLIDLNGRIWEGRSLRYQGAHVRDNNEGNIGVCVFGDCDETPPTAAQKESLKRLLEYLRTTYGIPKNRIYTHRELNTTRCPGDKLQAYVEQLRR